MLKVGKKYFVYFGLFAVSAFITCCSPKNNHKVLTFLFDGVPEQTVSDSVVAGNSSKHADTTAGKNEGGSKSQKPLITHAPYLEGNCSVCHDEKNIGMYTASQPELCYTCHADFSKKFAFVHGPVAGAYCTGCHNPHTSELPKLILRKGQDLCLYCHDRKTVLKNEIHADIGETNCTDCHNPHGGSDRYLF